MRLGKQLPALVIAFILFVTSASAQPGAGAGSAAFNPDPKSLVYFLMDKDGTIFHNLGHFVVKLSANPGLPGLVRVSGLESEMKIPVHDYEGTSGLRIRDKLGYYKNGQFIHGSLEPVKLADGTLFIPGHYYLDTNDPNGGLREFRPATSGKVEDGEYYKAVKSNLEAQNPFLLEALPFAAAAHSSEYGNRIRLGTASMRGNSSLEDVGVFNLLNEQFNWGPKKLNPNSMVNLSHPDWLQFSQSKGKYIQYLYQYLSRVNIDMTQHNVPHFLVMFENDFDKHLDEVHLKFRELANAGIFSNPVIPILVDLLEPEVFNNRGGTNWQRSSLETFEKRARVQIYWGPGNIEKSNDLSLVFQRTLGLSPQDAVALYQKYENPYLCRNILSGKENISCVFGDCLTNRGKK